MILLHISCVPDDSFGVPTAAEIKEIAMETNTDLDAVLGAFIQTGDKMNIVTFDQDLVIEAFVVSSDEAGNFFKKLIIQDAPVNPTAGIEVQINQAAYSSTYNFGRKIYVKLKGLSIGERNGVIVLGIANGKQVERIPQARISDYIIRTPEVVEIKPLLVKAIQFNDRLENLFIRIEKVQFYRLLVNPEDPFTFASEDNDEFDGERHIESCVGDFPVILSTSTYADFKSLKLPSKAGSLQGILTRDFYDDFFTIYLNSPDDIDFTEEERCDPKTLDCGLATTTGNIILFEEDFETQKNNSPVAGNGWANYIEEGSEAWEGFTATGTNASLGRSARVRPTGSGDHLSVSWLITPAIDFDIHTLEVLNFKTSTSFANHSFMEVLFSNDWNGETENFQEATWQVLSSAYVAKSADFFGDWISSGQVDLSCAEGVGFVAFKYTGSDLSNYDGIYELDDVMITAE